MTEGFLVGILLLIVSFLIINGVIGIIKGPLETKTAESICRGSVAAREATYTQIREPLTPAELKVGEVASPLLCRTIDKYYPENKDANREQVKKDFADLMANCWYTFGEGKIQDVFKEGDFLKKNCFTCYNVNLRETSDFKTSIPRAEMLQYFFSTPYKVVQEDDGCRLVNGGYCINSEEITDCAGKITDADKSYLLIDDKNQVCRKKGKQSCCYTDYGCWNKGGTCSNNNPDGTKYTQYNNDAWKCPSKMKCFIKKENYYSYGDYIQKFGGPGNLFVFTDIKPGEAYAVSFGSPTKSCELCTWIGLGGAAAGATGTAIGVSYALAAVPAVIAAFVPTAVVGVVVLAGGSIGYIVSKGGSEAAVENYFFERDINTVYLTTLNDILKNEGQCSLVQDIRDS
jgi:hypothetical protein